MATGFLYIVHRGIALYGGKVLTAGKVWGEDMILTSTTLQRKWSARAMNYLEVLMLSREELVMIADGFPLTARMIRRSALMLALRRYLTLAAEEVRKSQRESHAPQGNPKVLAHSQSNLDISFSKVTSSAAASLNGLGTFDKAFHAASSMIMSTGEQLFNHARLEDQTSRRRIMRTSKEAMEAHRPSNQLDPIIPRREGQIGSSGGSGEALAKELKGEMASLRAEVVEMKAMLELMAQTIGQHSGQGAQTAAPATG